MGVRKIYTRNRIVWLLVISVNFSLKAQITSFPEQFFSLSELQLEIATPNFLLKDLRIKEIKQNGKNMLMQETVIMPINEITITIGKGFLLMPCLLLNNLNSSNGGYLGPLLSFCSKGNLKVKLGICLNIINLKI